jgi:hypothetical protein
MNWPLSVTLLDCFVRLLFSIRQWISTIVQADQKPGHKGTAILIPSYFDLELRRLFGSGLRRSGDIGKRSEFEDEYARLKRIRSSA